jgi:hypothetical protein
MAMTSVREQYTDAPFEFTLWELKIRNRLLLKGRLHSSSAYAFEI